MFGILEAGKGGYCQLVEREIACSLEDFEHDEGVVVFARCDTVRYRRHIYWQWLLDHFLRYGVGGSRVWRSK
jgi:hypothetical protein